ncbi:MAG: metallophosphoesterase [Phycisphaeraceae bacterium]
MPLAYGLTDPIDLSLTHLPHALDRFRIAHLSDLHILKRPRSINRLINQLAKLRLDIGILTGDYMLRNRPTRESQALPYLRDLTAAVKPKLGWYGIFGNHDTPGLIEQLQELPINWLNDEAVALSEKPIEIVGLRCTNANIDPEPITAARAVANLPTTRDDHDARLRLVLSHRPDFLPMANALAANLMLSGHTHGGQLRLPFNLPLYNASDLPLHLSSGVLRHRDTLGVVSRGLGMTGLFGTSLRLRMFCPAHAPIITLRRNTSPGERTDDITCVSRW